MTNTKTIIHYYISGLELEKSAAVSLMFLFNFIQRGFSHSEKQPMGNDSRHCNLFIFEKGLEFTHYVD